MSQAVTSIFYSLQDNLRCSFKAKSASAPIATAVLQFEELVEGKATPVSSTLVSMFDDYLDIQKNIQGETFLSRISTNGLLLTAKDGQNRDQPEGEGKAKYTFSLHNPVHKIIFSTLCKVEYEKWVSLLTKRTVRADFSSRFEVQESLGSGATAEVFLAKEALTGVNYAIKVMQKPKLKEGKNLEALWQEICIMRDLDHPNIVKLHEVNETTHTVCLVMDYISGGDLSTLRPHRKSLEQSILDDILYGALQGLSYLEGKGIVHRDLKMCNIMLRKKEKITPSDVVIVDFGLASHANQSNPLFKFCGTPGYIAPESLYCLKNNLTSNLSSKEDIFGLAATIYALITGASPFYLKSSKTDELLERNLRCIVSFEGSRFCKISGCCINLLKKMLMANPVKRITAREALASPNFCHDSDSSEYEDFEIPQERKPEDKVKMENELRLKLASPTLPSPGFKLKNMAKNSPPPKLQIYLSTSTECSTDGSTSSKLPLNNIYRPSLFSRQPAVGGFCPKEVISHEFREKYKKMGSNSSKLISKHHLSKLGLNARSEDQEADSFESITSFGKLQADL